MTLSCATRPSGWTHSPWPKLAALLLSAVTVPACGGASPESSPGLGGRTTADGPPQSLTNLRTHSQSFYENDPTYVSMAPDDGFWQLSTPAAQNLDATVLDDAASALESVPSAFSLLVIRNGFLVVERYFHGSDVHASNNLHSASKSILSALVGIALDRGILKGLDQTVEQLLPDHSMKDAATASITLGNLLTMSSGLDWVEDHTEYEIQTQPDWVQAILDLPVTSTPGTYFNYSTGNAHLVSAILTQAVGQPLPAFATSVLFQPLGVSFEHWGKDPQGIASGGYNFYMTARAFARFALMAFQGGQSGGKQLVPASWLATSQQAQQPSDPGYPYGYFYWLPNVGGHAVAKMWGFGGQYAFLVPDENLVVILTNDTSQGYPEPDGDAFMTDHILPAILK